MSQLVLILQIVLVALGSFAVFAFFLSHLRYRKMELDVLDHAREALSPSAAVLWVLQILRETEKDHGIGMLRIETLNMGGGSSIQKYLKHLLRAEDEVILLETGVVIALVKGPVEHIPLIAKRMVPVLRKEGHESGSVAMWVPEWETETIFEWIQKGSNRRPQSGWDIHPEHWPYEPERIPAGPAVDSLTGVLKPDRVPRALRRMLATHRRIGKSTTLVRLDIDQLESYNEEYGRETGDLLLKTVAELLMQNCRESDLIGRLQEDEFVIAMHGEDSEVLQAVRRMSDVVKNHVLNHKDATLKFSIGCGLASMPKDGRNPMLLLERAGWAVLKAKKMGRGSCLAFHPDMKPSSALSAEASPDSF